MDTNWVGDGALAFLILYLLVYAMMHIFFRNPPERFERFTSVWKTGVLFTGIWMIVVGAASVSQPNVPMERGLFFILGIWAMVGLWYLTRATVRLRTPRST